MMNRSLSWCVGCLVALVFTLTLAGCQSAYYAAWEKLGVEKRDLLKKRVVAARDEAGRWSDYPAQQGFVVDPPRVEDRLLRPVQDAEVSYVTRPSPSPSRGTKLQARRATGSSSEGARS